VLWVRFIPGDLDDGVVAEIDERLAGVKPAHAVSVGWAVESGSRAWGFPSPDSDYDCRFIYVRDSADYLTPWLTRDVIETPLDEVFDVNGWDVRKAIQLMVQGNATVLEWLRSPIIYCGDAPFRDLLLNLAVRVAEPALLARHYAHVGRRNWERSGAAASGGPVKLKSLFYALRPAATLHWMRARPTEAVPPMRLQELLEQVPPSGAVLDAVSELVARKACTREMGTGPVPIVIREFVHSQLYATDLDGTGQRVIAIAQARAIAAETFRQAVRRFGAIGPRGE
jgi:predicted nucleotidyltransferase